LALRSFNPKPRHVRSCVRRPTSFFERAEITVEPSDRAVLAKACELNSSQDTRALDYLKSISLLKGHFGMIWNS
jgi:hypothetical protein